MHLPHPSSSSNFRLQLGEFSALPSTRGEGRAGGVGGGEASTQSLGVSEVTYLNLNTPSGVLSSPFIFTLMQLYLSARRSCKSSYQQIIQLGGLNRSVLCIDHNTGPAFPLVQGGAETTDHKHHITSGELVKNSDPWTPCKTH